MGSSKKWKEKTNKNLIINQNDLDFLSSITPNIEKTKEKCEEYSTLDFNELTSIYIDKFKGRELSKDELPEFIAIDFLISKLYPEKNIFYGELMMDSIESFREMSSHVLEEGTLKNE